MAEHAKSNYLLMNFTRASGLKRSAPVLGILLLTLLYYSDTLTGKFLLVGRDLASFFYPFRLIWIETAHKGQFPFWNPYIKCGLPLFATIQPGVLYPFSIVYLFLPLDLAFNWTVIFHFFLAGAFTYMLMRELGASVQGSFAGAMAFTFGGYLTSVHNVLNTLLSVSWYPLVVLCGCRMFKFGQVRWAVVSGLSLCCMFLGGGLEIVLFALATLFLLCLYPKILFVAQEENLLNLWRRLALLGLAFLTYLEMSMMQLLPLLELYPHSVRYGGVPLEEATRWSLAPQDLLYLLVPDLLGKRSTSEFYWNFQNYLKTIYVGPICLFLAVVHFVERGKRSLPLLTVMGLILILSFGRYVPVYPFLHKYLPFFSTLRYPVKFLFLFVFCLSVAAGLGFDLIHCRFAESRSIGFKCQVILITTAIILSGLIALSRFFSGRVVSVMYQSGGSFLDPVYLPMAIHNVTRLLVVIVLCLIVIIFGLRGKPTRAGTPLLLSLLILDLFLGNRGFAQKVDSMSFHATTPMVRTLTSDEGLFRFHAAGDRAHSRLKWTDYRHFHLRRKEALGYDLMMEHHLFDIDGYNVPLQSRYERFIGLIRNRTLEPPVPALLDMLNVKYVLAKGHIDLSGYVWIRDGLETDKLYKNENFLPRAFLIKNYRVLEGDQEFA